MYGLYKSVFGNIVISNEIFKHSRLYKKNENIIFYDAKELKEYPEREYISSIEYGDNDEELKVGDFPVCGTLKRLKLNCNKYVKGEIVPKGVEVLEYTFNITHDSAITTIPSTIHTVVNCSIINNKDKQHIIQPNITSISFSRCVNISDFDGKDTGSIIIPNTIKQLKFDSFWNNQGVPLRIGDIPFGVTNLEMSRVLFGVGVLPESLTRLKCIYAISNLYKNFILPNSLTHLEVRCDVGMLSALDYGKELFNFVPANLETLIIGVTCKITPLSNLFKCQSIKNLTIDRYDYKESKTIITPNSLPPNVTNLKMVELYCSILPCTIPSSVTNLCLFFSRELIFGVISQDSLPAELKVLEIQGFKDSIFSQLKTLPESLTTLNLKFSLFTKDCLVNLISKLPNSLTSLILPPSAKEFKLQVPNTIELTFNVQNYWAT